MKIVLTLQLVDKDNVVRREQKGELLNVEVRDRQDIFQLLRLGVVNTFQDLCPNDHKQ